MAFATAGVLARRGARGPMALLLIYCAGIFPALGFINVYPLRYSPVADHFGYVAGVALCIAIGWMLWTVWSVVAARARAAERAGTLAACVLSLTLAVLTWAQAWQYRDEPTLWAWTLRTNPRAWLAANYLGGMELDAAIAAEMRQDGAAMEAHLTRAEALISQALEHSYRRDMSVLANLSEVRRMDRKLPEALALLEEAMMVNDQFSKTIWARGSLHEQLGHMEQAGADYERAAVARPPDPRHWRDLVRWRAVHGTPQQALEASNVLLSQWPASAQDLANNASLQVQVGNIPGARAMFERAMAASSSDMVQRMLLPMAEAYLMPPHDVRSTERGIELADGLRTLVGEEHPQPLYMLARGHALLGDRETAAHLMAKADALLPTVPPQALQACTAARAQAAAALK
jgi:tetratricopeptide (TPR) repeat protein